ncbi:DNA repair protein RecN [Flavobacterium sp. NRK F10]|uniref:DNA repair protein RecN n=1 Tax=Flavobacterium sp. NRK F10 TaxID=2954931 RepID=UPI0020912E65|nr:DNA repair protein RecN [Flavobacterium sp. NRK F10]MCO6175770.1 DNA repair protein RecN [Flavobacterium sp. NRK F10]
MLLTLAIKNYALIDSLEINFSDRFSIITGETGAGKSILLGALGLVLGNRADLSSLKDEEQKCVVEAHFDVSKYDLKSVFEASDFDYEEVTIIRREILPSGKSRAFVNDSPVNLQELQGLANFLLDIHSQHQTRDLIDESYQIRILDAVAQNKELLAAFKKDLGVFKKLQKELQKLQAEKQSLLNEQEYNNFLLEELVQANLKESEQEELESEQEVLSNIEFVKENIDKVLALAKEEEIGILSSVNEAKNSLQKLASLSKEYQSLFERINSIYIELDDIIEECVGKQEQIVDDPGRLVYINERLQFIYNLQKKHNVNTVAELLDIQNQLSEKATKFDAIDSEIDQAEAQKEIVFNRLEKTADEISGSRQLTAPKLEQALLEIVRPLGMPDAQIQFEIKPLEQFSETGKDSVSLLFSANKGMKPGPIKKMASGGEMSRVMLAVKAVLAQSIDLPTIIFDEIDTGVSGEVALKMGEIMKEMSKKMQVFAITHLPQIAAKGNQHYKVFKNEVGGVVNSEIKQLDANERVVEIAEMLSGKNITDSALAHAQTLLN